MSWRTSRKLLPNKPPPGARLNPTHPLVQGLKGCWIFNEGTGSRLADHSGNGWHGTLTAMAADDWVGSPRGQALNFDGSDDRVSISTSFTLTFPFSISAWVYPTSRANWRNIFTKRDSFSSAAMVWQFDLNNSSGNVRLFHSTAGTDFGYAAPLNTWTHLCVTDGGTGSNALKLYVNGKFQAQATNSTALGTGTGATVQISGFNGTNELFAGNIDDVRVWTRILSADDVRRLYSDPYGCFMPQMQYASLGEAPATVVKDFIQAGMIPFAR